MRTPMTFAGPALGGTNGAHLGRPGALYRFQTSALVLLLMGVSIIAGILRQAPCLSGGYELPHASYRMCASPIANGLLGATFPEAAGRAQSQLAALSPADSYFVVLAEGLGSVSGAMGLLLILNSLAFVVTGVALLRLFAKKQWLIPFFFSPLVFFSIGQSLDPVGLALVAVALVLVLQEAQRAWALPAAGVLFALAVMVNPLAAVVFLATALHLHAAGRSRDLQLAIGAGVIALGLLLMFDARLFSRVTAWFGDAIDRGSLASLLAQQGAIAPEVLTLLFVIAWGFALTLTAAYLNTLNSRRGAGQPALSVASAAALLLAWSALLLPAGPLSHALWLAPFAAAVVGRVWVLLAWMLAETAMFIAVNLTDAYAIDSTAGLDPVWTGVITIIRLAAVALIATFAGLEYRAQPFRQRAVSSAGADRAPEAVGNDGLDTRGPRH